jgi:N-sulfoglucosamine sulfohydrolase
MKNILLLHTHDTGRCIQPYGYAVETPQLDAFARQGALFRQAFDCGPTCSPARASLLTGQFPHECGMLGLAHRGFSLKDPSKHLANYLRGHGYRTVLAGIQHETSEPPTTLGYEENNQLPPDPSIADVGRRLMARDSAHSDRVCEILRQKQERPFYISLGLFSTHRPFPEEPDADLNADYLLPPLPILDHDEARRDWAAFCTMARHVDRCFGQVLKTLAEQGLADNTLVIVTTDHGPAFPWMKCNLNDGGCGVMLMMRMPGMPAGVVSNALVSHLDVFPTLCEWTGLPPPQQQLRGTSLMPLLRGEEQDLHEELFAEINFHAARDIQRSVRSKRFRYVRRYDGYEGVVLPNIDDGLSKRLLRREADLEQRARIPEEQLFDLYYDPLACHSVAGEAAYASALADMRQRLQTWMQATEDPLLTGLPKAPAGSRINRQDDMEPHEGNWEPPEQ